MSKGAQYTLRVSCVYPTTPTQDVDAHTWGVSSTPVGALLDYLSVERA